MKISDLFTCDQCGGHQLEEVMVGVILTSRVESIDGTEMEYGEVEHQEGEVVKYQCAKCGNEVAENEDELRELLGVPKDEDGVDVGLDEFGEPTNMMFSFTLDGTCPHCGKRLEKVTADGHEAMVNDDGRLVEKDVPDTDLILNNSTPDVRCSYCNGELTVEATEE